MILESTSLEEIRKEEIKHIEHYRPLSYNIHVGGLGGDNMSYHPENTLIRKKLSEIHLKNAKRGKKSPLYIYVDEETTRKVVDDFLSFELPSSASIMRKYNISLHVLNRIIKETGNTTHRSLIKRFCSTLSNIERLTKYYTVDNLTLEEIGKKTNLSSGSIGKVIKRLKISRPIMKSLEKPVRMRLNTPDAVHNTTEFCTIPKAVIETVIQNYTVKKETIFDISKSLHINKHTVRKILHNNNIRVCRGTYFTETEIQEIVNKYINKTGSTTLAAQYGTTEDRIRSVLRKNNVPVRSFKEANNIRNIKRIGQYNKEGILLKEYTSVILALKELGVTINNGQISLVINSPNRTYKGFLWKSL